MVKQFTVVTASPNRLHFKEFLKSAGELRFLPFWSLEDLQRVLPYCDLPGTLLEKEVALAERFDVVGGNMRRIFARKTTAEWKSEFTSQVDQHARDIRSLLSAELVKDYNQAHNNLVAIHSIPPFEKARLCLSSKFVRDDYCLAARTSDRRARAEEIQAAWNDPSRAVEAGKKFEPFAFDSLFLGGRFPVYRIQANGTHEASGVDRALGPFQGSVPFGDASEVKDILPDVIYRPLKRNFPRLDFLALKGDTLEIFQMTVSLEKPNPSAIFADETVLPLLHLFAKRFPTGRVEVLFVLPDFLPKSFKITGTRVKGEKPKKPKANEREMPKNKETKRSIVRKRQVLGAEKDSREAKPEANDQKPFEFVDPSGKLTISCSAFVIYIPILPVPFIPDR